MGKAARDRWKKVQLVLKGVNDLRSFVKHKRQDSEYCVFFRDSYVWVPDEEECFLPAKVLQTFDKGAPGEVRILRGAEDTQDVILGASETKRLLRMDKHSLNSLNNLIDLKDLNQASILHNLRKRFGEDDIYTYVGSVVVSVNPFKQLSMCTDDAVLAQYLDSSDSPTSLPPHVYTLAKLAHSSLNENNQSCIVSGESGAGKTEATKIFLRYITAQSQDNLDLQQRIASTNPVMESFGNAKTVRNDNSSRFGKWIKVFFSGTSVVGASMESYLLEKSRVVKQSEGERNYHVFYQLLANSAQTDAPLFNLDKLVDTDVNYLQGEVTDRDHSDWDELVKALDVLEIEQNKVMELVSFILFLGQVSFVEQDKDEDKSKYDEESAEFATIACKLLQVSEEQLHKCLCFRSILFPGQKEPILKPRSVTDAISLRDVLAKTVYGALFEYLIRCINKRLKVGSTNKSKLKFIGVLDIFGFEIFTINSFEQLCINYCNEKLQQHFNRHMFEMERHEYNQHGIDVSSIEFKNNDECVMLLEASQGNGVFTTIDEQQKLKYSTDDSLLAQLNKTFKDHTFFADPPKHQSQHFTVHHYAGPVSYTVTNFLMKNEDFVHEDVYVTLQSSTNKFVQELFGKLEAKKKGKSKTIGRKFKEELATLTTTLSETTPHFIRCIKPNDNKASGEFSSASVLDQLNCAGLLEVCRIRQVGYPVRQAAQQFFSRYSMLAPTAKSCKQLCLKLEELGVMIKGEYQIGKGDAKVFMRAVQHNDLETAFFLAVNDKAVVIQNAFRYHQAQVKETRWLLASRALKAALKQQAPVFTVKELLLSLRELHPFSSNLAIGFPYAKDKSHAAMLARLHIEEVTQLETNLSNAVAAADREQIQTALENLREISPQSTLISNANRALVSIQLQTSISSGDMSAVQVWTKRAEQLGLAEASLGRDFAAVQVQKFARMVVCVARLKAMKLASLHKDGELEVAKSELDSTEPVVNGRQVKSTGVETKTQASKVKVAAAIEIPEHELQSTLSQGENHVDADMLARLAELTERVEKLQEEVAYKDHETNLSYALAAGDKDEIQSTLDSLQKLNPESKLIGSANRALVAIHLREAISNTDVSAVQVWTKKAEGMSLPEAQLGRDFAVIQVQKFARMVVCVRRLRVMKLTVLQSDIEPEITKNEPDAGPSVEVSDTVHKTTAAEEAGVDRQLNQVEPEMELKENTMETRSSERETQVHESKHRMSQNQGYTDPNVLARLAELTESVQKLKEEVAHKDNVIDSLMGHNPAEQQEVFLATDRQLIRSKPPQETVTTWFNLCMGNRR